MPRKKPVEEGKSNIDEKDIEIPEGMGQLIKFPKEKTLTDEDRSFFLLKEADDGWQVVYRISDKKEVVLGLMEALSHFIDVYLTNDPNAPED